MIRVSPAIRMSLGLMFITMTVLMFSNFIGLIPNRSIVTMETRKSIAESAAVRCTYAIKEGTAAIRKAMDSIIEAKPEILSMAMRSPDGKYVAQSGDHRVHWITPSGGDSTYSHWQVPIFHGKKRWATLEISFRPANTFSVFSYRLNPFTLLIAFFSVISFTGFVIFMKKSLRYLDPSSVMPSRVKHALDALTEGVLLIDTKGRIILSNSVFIEKLGCTAKELMGLKASQLNWVDHDTNSPLEIFPWSEAISKGEAQSGIPLDITTKMQGIRTFVVNSAPVLDDKGKSRGAVVTFDDVTELEKQSFQLSRMVELLQMSKDKINNKNKEINRKNKELEILASQDSLTECLNRRAFFSIAKNYLAITAAEGKDLACIMTDIDKFKNINDTYGHAVGDQAIQFVAKTLTGAVKGDDIVCRYGGEEFCILLPNCNVKNAVTIAETIRAKIEAKSAQAISETSGIHITASFGVSDSCAGANNIEEMLAQADKALYAAKAEGRNRVVPWERVKKSDLAKKADYDKEACLDPSCAE